MKQFTVTCTRTFNHPCVDVINHIQSNLYPEDVFGYKELEDWAIDNGFVAKND